MNTRERKQMIKGFEVGLNLTKEKVMVLESVCYQLEDIESKLVNTNETFSKSKYGFTYNNINIINMFKDIHKKEEVNPITYYGLENIKKSSLIEKLNFIVATEYSNSIKEIHEIEECAGILLSKVQSNVFENYTEGLFYTLDGDEKIISPYYSYIDDFDKFYESDFSKIVSNCYSNSIDKYESVVFYKDNLSNKDKKDIILELVNYENNYDTVDSFILERTSEDNEKFRCLLLDFIHWIDVDGYKYPDDYRLFLNEGKLTIQESLFLLLEHIYTKKYSNNVTNFEIKQALLNNNELKQLFFDSINILLRNPKVKGYQNIKQILS